MAFGSWSGREGTRSDDPWAKKDKAAERETQCSHDPEPELRGGRLYRSGRRGTKVALVVGIILAAIIFSGVAIIVGFFNYLNTVPLIPEISQIPGDVYGDVEEYFSQFFQTGTGSGVNYLERTDTDPEVSLEIKAKNGQDMTIQDVYEKCLPSIVGITTVRNNASGWGTGVIMSEDGYIITNSHVLEDATAATVTLWNDEEYNARLVGYDSFSDIAVIKIDCDGLTPAEFGDSDALRVGDSVVAIGNPLGIELRGTMTNGIVSAINREVNMDGHLMTLIQTNAQINGGNSGGALIDMQGRVMGITNMKMMAFGFTYEGLGFAIPTSTVKKVVDEIMVKGYVEGRPGIGITVGGISAMEQNGYSSPAGVYVGEVTPGSGADKAGMLPGDIITHADGVQIFTTADLNTAKDQKGVGDILVLTVWREGEIYEFDVEIMDMSMLFD